MEQVRNLVLDELCEEFADVEVQINKLTQRVKGIKSEALQEMQRTGGKVYKHAGAAFSRTPGADKINARLTTDNGHADDDTAPSDSVEAESGAEQLETAGV